MLTVRKANDRGRVDMGWLNSRHSFSFGHYYDPHHLGFGPLRVINEDRVQPGKGFAPHDHENMEIISYVVDGALEHKDSLGNGSVIRRGDVQRMTAGTGVRHSEFNHSDEQEVHFLQIWVEPDTLDLAPGYEEKRYETADKENVLRLVASREGRDGSITLHRDADLFASIMTAGTELEHALRPGRNAWLQVVSGEVDLNGVALSDGDGVAATDIDTLTIRATRDSEVLLFDMR